MSRFAAVVIIVLSLPAACLAQVGGNAAYAEQGAKGRVEQKERANRELTKHELPPTDTSMFVEANVLANVQADEYLAVFAVAQEGETVAECGKKMEAVLKTLAEQLQPLGIGGDNVHVDFVAQNKIYGFEIMGDLAREKLAGFELKKNVAIRFPHQKQLDQLLTAAAKAEIYDLIKVDYVVKDVEMVQGQLMEKAASIIQKKLARYEQLLGTKVSTRPQIYAERHAIHYPKELYDSYVAQESERVNSGYRRDLIVQGVRKSRTFYYNGLDGNGFDAVINPVVIDPHVQFTLHLKLKYEIDPGKAK